MSQDVDLGKTEKGRLDESNKMIYMSIQTTIVIISEIYDCGERPRKLSTVLANTVKTNFTLRTIRKTIFELYGVNTVRKMQNNHSKEYKIYTELLGQDIWGLQK